MKYFIASAGIMATFMYLGVTFLVAVVLGAQLMINPPAGFKPAGWTPRAPAPGAAAAAGANFSTLEMLKTVQFYLLWITCFAGCMAGLMIIMNITNIWQSQPMLTLAKTMPAVSQAAFKTIADQGAAAVMIVAILNAAGRLVWGQISDFLGRKLTLIIIFAYAGVIMLFLNSFTSYALFLFGVCSIGVCFGGFLGLYPAVTADYFGTKNVGANYGLMFTAYGVGGLFGPWLAPKLMTVVGKIPYEALEKGIARWPFFRSHSLHRPSLPCPAGPPRPAASTIVPGTRCRLKTRSPDSTGAERSCRATLPPGPDRS